MKDVVKKKYGSEVRSEENVRNYSYRWNPRNPISIYYRHQRELTLVKALNKLNIHLDKAKILDVGCGNGNVLRYFAELGADPKDLYGIDITDYRITEARAASPRMNFVAGDATKLPYDSEYFDIVMQFTTFSSIPGKSKQKKAANEMLRVLKKSGLVIWYDMKDKYSGLNQIPQGLPKDEVLSLFVSQKVLFEKYLHSIYLSKTLNLPSIVAHALENAPFLHKTNYLVVLGR